MEGIGISLCSLFFKRLFIGFHPLPHLVFLSSEDGESHAVNMMPSFSLVNPHVCSNALNHIHQVSNATVNISCARVGICAENMRHFRLLVVLDEIPDLLVRAERSDEFALLVLNSAKLDWILDLFFFVLLT